jgi:hypothetical protein
MGEIVMKIKDLLQYVVDDICIYREVEDGLYEGLYKGNAQNVPCDLLEMQVRLVGARKKLCLDIQVKN